MKMLIRLLAAVLSFVLLSSEPAIAGAPPLQWQNTFGGSGHDRGGSVQQTSDGGYIIAGTTLSYSAGTVYLIKTDPNGNSEWEKTFGGSLSFEEGHSVQQTSDGGYIIAGTTSYSRYDVPTSDVYLIKTDPNGNSEWQKTFGFGADYDYRYRDSGSSVQQTSDGGYIIVGYTYLYTGPLSCLYPDGEYIIAGYTLSSGAGGYDIYLIKTDPNGNMQWEKTFGGSDGDSGSSVQQTTDGGYIIAGSTESYGTGDRDIYLIKTDPNGISEWQKTFGGSDDDAGGSVQQTSDGGYIIAGTTLSYGAGEADVYLIKTDPNGNSQWQQTFGGSDSDYGNSVQQTSDGGYIIAGLTYSYGAGQYDVYLIKSDPNGNSEWQKTVGGSDEEYGGSVRQTSDGGYIIAGSTESYGAGDLDVYLIKLCSNGTLSADFNCNGTIYFEDLTILTDQWLQPPGILSADMAPEPGDGIVNFLDFAAFAQDWLETTTP